MFSRTPPPARVSGDRRRGLTLIFAAIVLAYLVLTALGTLWTDYLWFDSVGFASVWQRRWLVGIALGALGLAIVFLVIWLNLFLVDRLGPRYLPADMNEEEELVVRFHEWSRGRGHLLRLWVSILIALLLGLGMAAWRDDLFLFLGRQTFGVPDPIFKIDAGFYVFQFPIIQSALSWLFNLGVAVTIMVALGHYLNGGIRIRRGSVPSITRRAKIHLSVILAVLALVRATMYRMDALALLFSGRQADSFYGPGYTDITARLPALRLLMAVAAVTAVVFIVNIWRRGWVLVMVSVGAWILVSVAALLIYPAIVDRLQVQPQPLARESQYIANNVEFTRAAYGLDQVEVRDFKAADDLNAPAIEANRLTVDNVRLWDSSVLPRTYQSLQSIRPYYALDRVDTDRYVLDGNPTQTMVAVRELDEANLERNDWMNTHLIYTHGIGAVVSQANAVSDEGQPVFLLSDLPPVTSDPTLELSEPRIYFGESYRPGRPVIVKTGTGPQEVDMPLGGGEGITNYEYQGPAGVSLGSLWRRIAFAFRYRDLNLLISGQIRPDSRVLVERNVRSIVKNLAPFLAVDTDPYPVVQDGHVVWVVDLYTSSDHYPYSQPVNSQIRSRLPRSTDIRNGMDYLTNSVKATVDAYDGTVHFYVTDNSDPVIRAWQAVYPGLFEPGTAMPQALVDHLRYPQDLFRVQGEIWLNYHVDAPSEFFSRNDAWSIPPDPATIRRGEVAGSELLNGDGLTTSGVQYLQEILPYYLLTRLPGEDALSYVLLQPFNPRDKPNMSSFMVADAPEPGKPSRLIDFRMPQGILVGGTGQIGDRIQQDDEISAQFTLWGQQGSNVIQGDLLVVPIEDSILYIEPIYLQSSQSGGFPEFRRVVVVYGDQIEWASSLNEAMDKVFNISNGGGGTSGGGGTGGGGTTGGGTGGSVPGSVQDLLNQAADLLNQADSALRAGDLGKYQELVDQAAQLINEARQEASSSASLP